MTGLEGSATGLMVRDCAEEAPPHHKELHQAGVAFSAVAAEA